MKLKSKLALLGFVGAATVGAVAPLAVSCSKSKNTVVKHVTQSDEDIKYGLSEKTFNNLKSDYVVQVQKQMLARGIRKGSETWNNEMNNLNVSLETITNYSQNAPMSYGQLTNGVIDHARITHGITLRRTTTASFDDIEDEFQGAIEAFKAYGQHSHLPTSKIKEVIATATESYKAKIDQLTKQGYRQNDPYGALLKVRADLFDFFQTGNAAIAKIAAMNKLANYKHQYVFSYKKNTNTAYLENVRNKLDSEGITVGSDMTSVFDDIFELYDNEKGTKLDKFDPSAIPGYTITPIYQGIELNPESNQSNIKFSLEIVSNHYLHTNDDEKRLATASQLKTPEDEQHFRKEIEKLPEVVDCHFLTNEYFDLFDKVNDSHLGFFSPSQEKTQLETTYFDGTEERISFVWPVANERTRYESFFTSKQLTDNSYQLNTSDLADAGIQISDGKSLYYLSDVLSSVSAKQKIDGFDPAILTFVEKFVYYCDVIGESTILDKNAHKVSTNLHVFYKNTLNAKDGKHTIENCVCEGYKISEKEFIDMSKTYNAANGVYSMYAHDSQIMLYMIMDNALLALNILLCALNVYYASYWAVHLACMLYRGYFIYDPTWFKTKSITGREIRFVMGQRPFKYMFFSLLGIAGSSYLIDVNRKRSSVSTPLYNGIRHLMGEDYIKSLAPIMKEGEEIFVKLSGPELDKYDPIEYAEKYNKFREGDYEHYKMLETQYKKIIERDGQFDKLTVKHKVELPKIEKFLEDRTWVNRRDNYIIEITVQALTVGLTWYVFYVTSWQTIKDWWNRTNLVNTMNSEMDAMVEDAAAGQMDEVDDATLARLAARGDEAAEDLLETRRMRRAFVV